jgi:hypothetical protein
MTDAAEPKKPDGGVSLTLSVGRDVLAGWTRHGLSFGGGALAMNALGMVKGNAPRTAEEVLGSAAAVAAALAWSAFQKSRAKVAT